MKVRIKDGFYARFLGILLGGVLLAACGGGGQDNAPGTTLDVRSAADACIADPGVAEDPALRTECMITRLAEACATDASADPACNEPDAEFQQQIGVAMGEFCLLETDYYTNIIDTVAMCLRNGFAWGCTWLQTDIAELAQCVVETASVVCAAPLVSELPLCSDGQLPGVPGPDGEPGLIASLLGMIALPCREGPEDGTEMCENTALDALCTIPLAHSLNLCWSTIP